MYMKKQLKLGLQSIRERINWLRAKPLNPQSAKIITVPINKCRHYCAFKYGSNTFNPYENYIIGLQKGVGLSEIRRQFEDFLLYFRPRNFGEVFDIELSRGIPLWVYPWQEVESFNSKMGWLDNLNEVPDIITHFCEDGIKRSQIDEEYFWLERAYSTIAKQGYRPQDFSFVEAIEFNKEDKNVYLLQDGNHRVSALAALGYEKVMIKVSQSLSWDGENHREWAQVRFGLYSEQDAIKLFNVYFFGVSGFRRSIQPAKIVEDTIN